MADYFAYLREEGRNADSVRGSESRAEALILPRLGLVEVELLTAKRLRTWRDDLVKSAPLVRTRKGEPRKHRPVEDTEDARRARRASANRVWTILRAALNRAFQDGKVSTDKAWRQVKSFRGVDGTRPHWLTLPEAKRLINAADSDFRLLVQGALKSGARYGSLARVRVRDFHEHTGVIEVRTRKGDGTEKIFKVILTDEGAQFFKQVCAGRQRDELIFTNANDLPWKRSEQIRPMEDLCKRAKIKPAVGFNQLRHTWASLAVMNGTPLMVVAQNLGHADTRMVEKHYGHLAPSFVADAIRAGAPRFGMPKAGNVRSLARQ
jgi:integrase